MPSVRVAASLLLCILATAAAAFDPSTYGHGNCGGEGDCVRVIYNLATSTVTNMDLATATVSTLNERLGRRFCPAASATQTALNDEELLTDEASLAAQGVRSGDVVFMYDKGTRKFSPKQLEGAGDEL
jgi:hypothetical protein